MRIPKDYRSEPVVRAADFPRKASMFDLKPLPTLLRLFWLSLHMIRFRNELTALYTVPITMS